VVTLVEIHGEVRDAIKAGAWEHSRHLCDAVLSLCGDNLETRLLLAEIDFESGAHRGAIAGFERVLASDPEAYLACAGLGIAHEGLWDPAGAAHWFSRALDLNPLNAEIRHELDRAFHLAYPGRPGTDGRP
jgi:tetratricopeptide (TPR) repeat protein